MYQSHKVKLKVKKNKKKTLLGNSLRKDDVVL